MRGCIHSGRVGWFALVVAMLAFILALACSSALAQTPSPAVPVGGSATFPEYRLYTGTRSWQISSSNGTVIASSATPNGWSVTYNKPLITVAAPNGAALGGYVVYTASNSSHYYGVAFFQVVTGPVQPVLAKDIVES